MRKITHKLFVFLYLLVCPVSLLADSSVELRHVRTLNNDFAITTLAWHPDGRQLAVGQVLNKRVAIWDTQIGKIIRTLEKETGGVRTLAYSPDGRYLAVGREFSRLTQDRAHVHLYDATNGNLVKRFPASSQVSTRTSDAEALAFSQDSRYLAASGYGSRRAIVVYDILKNNELAHTPEASKDKGTVEALAFSPDGRFLAFGRNLGTIEVWSINPWKQRANLDGQDGGAHALTFSPDGKYLVSGTNIGERWDRNTKPARQMFGNFPDDIVLWTVPAFEKAREFPSRHFKQTPNSSIIERLQFSPDGKLLLISARAGSLEIIDVTTGQAALYKDGFSAVVHAALSRDGKQLALSVGKKIEIHDLIVR